MCNKELYDKLNENARCVGDIDNYYGGFKCFKF